MTEYHVGLETRATVSQEAESVTVRMIAPNYNEAWVDSRTICRLGTNAKRVFKVHNPEQDVPFDEAQDFHCSAAAYTVRKIFVQGTRKKGKKRMTELTGDQLLQLCQERNIHVSKKLADVLKDVIKDSEGVRITVATARKLGLLIEETTEPGDEADKKTA